MQKKKKKKKGWYFNLPHTTAHFFPFLSIPHSLLITIDMTHVNVGGSTSCLVEIYTTLICTPCNLASLDGLDSAKTGDIEHFDNSTNER
jgi:hypothetical protein